jgi:hypothetical protein
LINHPSTAARSAQLIGFSMIVLLCGCRFFPESQFELAPDSPLPKWFTLPTNLSREDVTVQMSYYIEACGIFEKNSGLGCATFALLDISSYMKGKKQAVITKPYDNEDLKSLGFTDIQYFGLLDMHDQKPTMSWEITHPYKLVAVDADIKEQKNVQGYPLYVVVHARGISEVVEHKHPGNVFYINEDPALRAKFGLEPSPEVQPAQK